MRNHSMFQFRLAISSVVLAIASLSPALQAQAPEFHEKTIIPFGFEVGSTHFAPGPFTLRNQTDYIISVRTASDSALALIKRETDLHPAPASKLIFHKYGDQYFLAEVWAKNSTVHLSFVPSKAETQAKRLEQASNPTSVKNNGIEIALFQTSNR
jgi:hypothetical protein